MCWSTPAALRGDAIAMATDIDRARQVYDFDPDRFDAFFSAQGRMRQIPAAFILKKDGTVVTSVKLLDQWENVLMPPPAAIAEAERDGASLIAPGQSNQVGVVVELKDFEDQFLYVARPMDARVLSQVRLAQSAAADYRQLEQSRSSTQMAFAVVFLGVTLALLLAAIWVGIGFANRLVAPIQRLVLAADYVSKGNLMVEVPVRAKEGDLALLGQTFNKMTVELRSQRAELVAANEQIDQRRRFTEAVLSGVNSGVIGVGRSGEVTLANRAALVLLDTSEANVLGKALADVMPEIAPVMSEIDVEPSHRTRHTQVVINRDGQDRTLNVRINPETEGSDQSNAVVTLDDITDLVTAQRSAAWADVARRIAHEIKNPLTPIQLSAERIRRRFGKLITDDGRAVFDQCVDTIIRQVGDIERMVNEFSAFARMAEAEADAGRCAGAAEGVGVPDLGRAPRHHLHLAPAGRPRDQPFRRPPPVAGLHQCGEERHGGDRGGAGRNAWPRHDRRPCPHRRGRGRHRRHRQRHRPAAGKPQPAAGAVCHHAREGHRARPRHRAQDS